MAKGKYEKWLTPDGLTLLEAWARDGLTDEQLAHNMGISVATLYNWKRDHLEILEALSRGKEIVDIEVENDLLKKAHGYNAKIQKTFKVKEVYYDAQDRRCEKEHLESATDEVHVPADTQAITWWLKNRKPDTWRDKPIGTDSAEEQINQNIQNIANLLNHPAENRSITDYEADDKESDKE